MATAYAFASRWQIAAPPAQCWAELERFVRGGGSAWWPGVHVHGEAVATTSALGVGDRLDLIVRSPLGYRLRTRLTVTSLVPGETIAATGSGDLRGSGSVRVSAAAGGTRIDIRWDVVTTRRWMNVTAPLLRPVFAAAHTWVMARGERGLRRAVADGSH